MEAVAVPESRLTALPKDQEALEGGPEAWQRAGYPMKAAAAAQRSA